MKRVKFLSLVVLLLCIISGCGNKEELSENINNNESVESTKIEDKTLKCSAVKEYVDNDCTIKKEVDLIFNFKNDNIVNATYHAKETILSEDYYYNDKSVAITQELCLNEENYSDKCEIELVSDTVLTTTAYREIQKNEKTLFSFELDISKYNTYENLYNFINEDKEVDENTYYFECE